MDERNPPQWFRDWAIEREKMYRDKQRKQNLGCTITYKVGDTPPTILKSSTENGHVGYYAVYQLEFVDQKVRTNHEHE